LTVVLAIGHGEERIATLAGWPDRIGHLAGPDSLT
jgi:hypothetical protein